MGRPTSRPARRPTGRSVGRPMDVDGPIVVGVDGSATALDALTRAVDEAGWAGYPLRIVHALSLDGGPGWRLDAVSVIHAAALVARARQPLVEVGTFVSVGPAGPVLVAESAFARLVVVGARATHGRPTVLTGSTCAYLCGHSRAPVLLVRPGGFAAGPAPSGPVVVGLSGQASEHRAVALAAAEAAARGGRLIAVEVGARLARRHPRTAADLITHCRRDH